MPALLWEEGEAGALPNGLFVGFLSGICAADLSSES